jgi:hypothetical protein
VLAGLDGGKQRDGSFEFSFFSHCLSPGTVYFTSLVRTSILSIGVTNLM